MGIFRKKKQPHVISLNGDNDIDGLMEGLAQIMSSDQMKSERTTNPGMISGKTKDGQFYFITHDAELFNLSDKSVDDEPVSAEFVMNKYSITKQELKACQAFFEMRFKYRNGIPEQEMMKICNTRYNIDNKRLQKISKISEEFYNIAKAQK